jgi:hypothetical protein
MNYFNYFTEIEEEFVRRRGSHLLVSPLDWSLMETWKQRGVPLHIVLRGINASFDTYEQRVHRGRKVNSLFYCRSEVDAMYLDYCESRVGSNGTSVTEEPNGGNGSASAFSTTAIVDYLREHRETLRRLGVENSADAALNQTFERTSMRLDQIIEDLISANNISTESLETDLTMIEEVILDGLKESAGDEKLKELEQEGHRQLHAYRRSMEKEVYQQTLNNFIARRLRELYHAPRLSLFYL